MAHMVQLVLTLLKAILNLVQDYDYSTLLAPHAKSCLGVPRFAQTTLDQPSMLPRADSVTPCKLQKLATRWVKIQV